MSSPTSAVLRRATLPCIEALDPRTLLSVSITWSNRGNTSSDTDRFNAVFGGNASTARAVIDAVLSDWSNAITSFNRSDGTSTLPIAISMNATGTGLGANGSPSTTVPADGKPRSGSISIGRGNDTNADGNGDGAGFFLDPTPTDSSEFMSTIFNAFSANRTASTFDLYTVVSLEVTHVLGLVTGTGFNSYKLATSGYLSSTTTADTAEAGPTNTGTRGYYAKFDGPTIDHLMTTNNGGSGGSDWGSPIHTAGAAASLNVGGTIWKGGEDSGNAVFGTERYLPNEVMLRIFADAYGYSIQDPTTLPTMYSVLNSATGELIVRGGEGVVSTDTITLEQVGTKLRVSVDIGNDAPASGALPGDGNLPAYVREYDLSSVTSILVYGQGGNDIITVDTVKNTTVYGGDGADTIRVARSTAGTTTKVYGGVGNDQLYVGVNNNVEAVDGVVQLDGESDADTVWYEDSFNTFITPYLINGSTITRAGAAAVSWTGVDAFRLAATNAGANVTVQSIQTPATLTGGNGSDTFTLGNTAGTLDDLDVSFTIEGGSGTSDAVTFNDQSNPTPPVYQITSNTLSRVNVPAITFNGTESAIFNGTGATDEFHIASTGTGGTYRFFGGGNSDRFYIGDGTSTDRLDNIDGPIIIDGQGGSGDEVRYYDQSESAAQSFVLTETGVTRGGMASVSLTSVEDILIEGGSGGDTFDVSPSTIIEYVVDGNSGSDTLLMRTVGTTSPVHTPSGTSGTWTFGNRQTVSYVSMDSVSVPGTNTPPTIGSLTASPNSVTQGQSFTITANSVVDPDGSVIAVYFYRESNGTAGFQTDDSLLGTDSVASNGFSLNVLSNAIPIGTHTLYSRALDNGNATGAVVSTTVTITAPANQPPTIASLGLSANPVTAGNSLRVTANGVNDAEGALQGVTFFRESNGVAGYQAGAETFLTTDYSGTDGYYVDVNTFGLLGSYTYYAVATDGVGQTSAAATATGSVVAPPAGPRPYYYTAFFDIAPMRMFYVYLEDVGASIDINDVVVRNLATNQTIPINSFQWDAANRAANYSLSYFPPDGNYRATLVAGQVSASGVPLASDIDYDFQILRGDANRDRKVDFSDLLILAQNYGLTNRGFSQGNFDLDPTGTVNFDDLLLLAQRYGTTALDLLPTVAPTTAAPAKKPTRRPAVVI